MKEKAGKSASMMGIEDDAKKTEKVSADKLYEKLMKHYSSKYGRQEGYKKARENIAFAIAAEIFAEFVSPRASSYYYHAARDALSMGSKELALELIENAERTFSAWNAKFKIGNAQGYFIQEEIKSMRELLRE